MIDPEKIKKIAVLTGGGDCPGLNAVIKGLVRSARSDYGWEVLGIQDGFDGLLESRTELLNSTMMSGLQLKGGTILGTSNRGNPLRYPMREKGKSFFKDVTGDIVRNIKKMKIDVLVAVGGDGTMKIAQAIYEKGIPVVGVPKTIDNDLDVTDVTFGFNSAVDCATSALDRLHTTAESHHRVLVLEVMGRDCGWIALEAGIAGGADVILIPEIPFDLNAVCGHILDRKKRGKKFSIVIVAEGAFPEGGRKVYEKDPGADGTPGRLGGIGRWVAEKITLLAKMETRVTVLGHIQRGGTPTTYDRILATRFGVEAAHLIGKGHYGKMVCLRGREIRSADIRSAVKKLKVVDPEGQMVRTAESLGASVGRYQESPTSAE
ncbi:MAG: ATP-dependent 6-phosphofructokinase [Candidatus Krumholzibacteriota bacterium]|nr:ATP-dependent 6-phosphofructokinase [Candidatus Krumholzibacteriota bacterium]